MPPNCVSILDEYGQPFSARLHDALTTLTPRLQRQFPPLSDEYTLTEVLESAAHKIAAREETDGPVDELHSYAWVVAKRTAVEHLERNEYLVAGGAVPMEDARYNVVDWPSTLGTEAQIEARILVHQLETQLGPADLQLCTWKQLGLTMQQIADEQGTSVSQVVHGWRRIKRKLYNLAGRDTSY
jgi:DNA-binding CsgD family transcriptional regulator